MDTTPPSRTPYPSDVDDEEWAVVVPDLTLMDEAAPQRRSPLPAPRCASGSTACAGSCGPGRRGGGCRRPTNLPPWPAVDEQPQRWLAAGCFERLGHDRRVLIRLGAGRAPEPTAVIRDRRTMPSTPERGARAGYDGAKRRQGTKLHRAVDTLGHLLALHVTPASEQDRAQVGELARQVPAVTGWHVTLAEVDPGDTSSVPG